MPVLMGISRLERRGRLIDKYLPPLPQKPDAPEPQPVGPRFIDFIERVNPTLLQYEHVPRMASVLQRVADGEIKRLIMMMPPRFFKSEMASRLFSAYYLARYPSRKVGIVSYGASLAWELSEEARNYYEQAGGIISSDTSAKRRWRVLENGMPSGEMWADGMGGALLGRGYHLGIIDDPLDPQQASSPVFQKRFREWYPSKFYSRREPGAAIIVVMQRLGPADPIDFLFRREIGDGTDAAPEHWHVVCFDEIHSDELLWRSTGPMGLPPTCTLEPDWRKIGEPLAPSRFSLAECVANQKSAGPVVAKAQRQQRPSALTGDFWKQEWFINVYDELPKNAYNGGRDWDTAYTKNDLNSASAQVESYRGPGDPGSFPIYIEDVDWAWCEFPELVAWILSPHAWG